LADALELGRRDSRNQARNPGLSWRAAAIEAHLTMGDDGEAKELAAKQLDDARRWGTSSALGEAMYLQGLAEGSGGVESLTEAVEVLAGSPGRLQHARALVDLGAALRRSGKRREARDPLKEGLEAARACGATALVERAHAELVTAGARPRRLQFSGADSLTASERRVATMAAEGQTNREIAQALFVTVKTVETHLSRVYNKLGISSREQLDASLSSG
jgi:DNA-binding CsgD family transcriptional regulator